MEDALRQAYEDRGKDYLHNRVIDNLSGNRTAEPTSVAIVSSVHTLTCLLLNIMQHVLDINLAKT